MWITCECFGLCNTATAFTAPKTGKPMVKLEIVSTLEKYKISDSINETIMPATKNLATYFMNITIASQFTR